MGGLPGGGGAPGGTSDNRKPGAGSGYAKGLRARGGRCMTSGRPQGPSPHPAPRRPRPAGPEPLYPGARGPLSPAGPARPCRLRHPEQRTHSSSAIFSPILRASETTELDAAVLAGPAAASGFRCGRRRGLAAQGDPLPSRLGGPRVGRPQGLSLRLFDPSRVTIWPLNCPTFSGHRAGRTWGKLF